MSDNLAIVNRIIEEHHKIRGHTKLVGDSVSDLEALFTLQRARPDLILSSPEALLEKLGKLQQTISFLDEGLKNHFSFEEIYLPPLLGEVLMRALALEHQGIRRKINEARATVAETKPERLDQKELPSQKYRIQQAIEGILQVNEKHIQREETLLNMLKEALEAGG